MIGTQIREIRKEKKLKQSELAENCGMESGITQEYISRLEQGKAINPSWDKIVQLFNAMDYDIRIERRMEIVEYDIRTRKVVP